jgi:hypothetical protein
MLLDGSTELLASAHARVELIEQMTSFIMHIRSLLLVLAYLL